MQIDIKTTTKGSNHWLHMKILVNLWRHQLQVLHVTMQAHIAEALSFAPQG